MEFLHWNYNKRSKLAPSTSIHILARLSIQSVDQIFFIWIVLYKHFRIKMRRSYVCHVLTASTPGLSCAFRIYGVTVLRSGGLGGQHCVSSRQIARSPRRRCMYCEDVTDYTSNVVDYLQLLFVVKLASKNCLTIFISLNRR
jgi:hypothetical protein